MPSAPRPMTPAGLWDTCPAFAFACEIWAAASPLARAVDSISSPLARTLSGKGCFVRMDEGRLADVRVHSSLRVWQPEVCFRRPCRCHLVLYAKGIEPTLTRPLPGSIMKGLVHSGGLFESVTPMAVGTFLWLVTRSSLLLAFLCFDWYTALDHSRNVIFHSETSKSKSRSLGYCVSFTVSQTSTARAVLPPVTYGGHR
jgi:hypothetical protein